MVDVLLKTLAAGSFLAALPAAAILPSSVVSPASQTAQVPGVYRLRVGDLRVTALSDGTVAQDFHALLLNTSKVEIDALLRRAYQQNPVETSINAFLIESGTRRILVDTGAGDLFGPGNGGKLVASLAAAGFRPEQIDDILITHVHTDHSGGLVQGGRMIFPNATVHAAKADVDFFLDKSNAAKTGYLPRLFDEAAVTLKPYVDAGKVAAFPGAGEVLPREILPGITATLHPGHTPGTAFFVAESRGERIAFIGDVIHVGAVQLPRPGISIVYDLDPKEAARVRAEQFPLLAGQRLLIAAPHLPFPGLGHIRREAVGFSWVPVEYANRTVG